MMLDRSSVYGAGAAGSEHAPERIRHSEALVKKLV
jgi:hypothetical protein